MRLSYVTPPLGSLHTYPSPGHHIPLGWALTLGQALTIAVYPDLYAVLGITYGDAGPGTFRLPDLKDDFSNPLLIYTG